MAILIALTTAGPEPSTARVTDAAAKKLERIQRQIEREQEKLIRARERERSIFSQLRTLDSLVSLQRNKEAALKKRMDAVELRMEAARLEEERLEGIIKVQRRRLGKRFRAMYMDGTGGLIELMLTADSFTEMSRREVYFRALAKADGKLIEDYRGNIKVLRDVQQQLAQQRERLIALKGEVEIVRKDLEKKRAGKANLLRAAREDRDTHIQVIKELRAASGRVVGVIAGHEKKEEKLRAEKLARRKALLEVRRRATPETEIALESLPPIESPPEPREGGFAAQRGRMCAPSRGSLTQRYGTQTNPRFGTKTYSKGIAIAASRGAPIRAVWDGEVVYAGWFGGYGKVLIVSHGDHYYTLYAHASSLLKGTGSKVKRGELIARVGDTGSLEGSKLYFEVRRGSRSLNPLGWVSLGC